MSRIKFDYPMLVDRGYVHGKEKYPILRTMEKDGELYVYFRVTIDGKTRIFVGVCDRRVVIVHRVEVVLAKLAKEQDEDEYVTIIVRRPTRSRSNAKIKTKQKIADKPITPDTYDEEKYALSRKLAEASVLISNRKKRELTIHQLAIEHKKEIKKRELLEQEKEKLGLGMPDTTLTVTNPLQGLSAMAAMT